MVLQETETPPDSFSTSDDLSSENNAYTSLPSGSRYDASSLPQPLPIIAPLLGITQTMTRIKTETTLNFAEQRIGRSLTRDESQALATHLYKLEQTKSYTGATGVVLGVWRWYTTMAENRYPLYKPNPEKVDPNKFSFVKGPQAQIARQSWRLMVWYLAASEMGKLLGHIFAQPALARTTANDPRLTQLTAELRHEVDKSTTRPRVPADQQKKEWMEAIERDRAAKAGQREAWSTQSRKAGGADDDMSPTAGNESWESTSGGSWGSEFSSESSSQPQAQRQQQRPSQPWGSPNRRTPPPADDDASPTAGLFQEEMQNQSRPGESAWERLRRGGAPSSGQSRPARREQQAGSTLGDAFTFSESEEERRREQEKAQREFDARIERERQGKDFNDERRRW